MRAITLWAVAGALAALTTCGCSSSAGSAKYGNLPVGHPGPANAIAKSIPTLTPAQRQQVMIRKFGADVAGGQSPSGPNP